MCCQLNIPHPANGESLGLKMKCGKFIEALTLSCKNGKNIYNRIMGCVETGSKYV
jgi:hypothetical protein